jgi:hypothetical protein
MGSRFRRIRLQKKTKSPMMLSTRHSIVKLVETFAAPIAEYPTHRGGNSMAEGDEPTASAWQPSACILCECNCGIEVQLGGGACRSGLENEKDL